MSPTSSLKQQHQLFRISDYHFDVFLDHVRTALGGEDPEAADLAPAQLENLRQHVVLTSRARACPVSGNTASNGRACPFARRSNDGSAPLLDRVGGSEEIEKILAHMEREAASSSILVPFLQNQDELPCRIAIRNLLATAAAGDKLPEVDPQKLRDKHASLQMLPEHREKWLSCFNKSMVAHILPPEVAEKLQTCFQSLVSSMVGPTEAEQEDDAEEDRIAEERESAVDWGRLQGLMDELEGEKGLSKLIEAWYQRISEDPAINVFFTGTRPQVMMFQTRFWKKVLRSGLEPDGRRQLQLINVHQHLRITHNHFDSFVRCLMLACDQLRLSQPSSNNMRAAVECFRPQIVSEN